MPSTGTESTSTDGRANPSAQTDVVLSGQVNEDGLRLVLKQIAQVVDVKHGVLRVHSKDVRGYIGTFAGEFIVGAHVMSGSQEYGGAALKKLLSATQGMYVFREVPEQPPDLRQALNLSIEQLLSKQPQNYKSGDRLPPLSTVVDELLQKNSPVENVATEPIPEGFLEQLQNDGAFLAWGGQMPVLASNLSRLAPRLTPQQIDVGGRPTLPLIPVPDDLDELAKEVMARTNKPKSYTEPPPVRLSQLHTKVGDPTLSKSDSAPSTAIGQAKSDSGQKKQASPESWSPADLDSIATPGTTPSKYEDDVKKALRITSAVGLSRSLASPDKRWLGKAMSAADDKALSALVSGRVAAVDPKSFVQEQSVGKPQKSESFSKFVLIGGLFGLGMVVMLAQHLIQFAVENSHFTNGIKALNEKSYVVAKADFTEVINNNPEAADAYCLRALAETRLDEFDNALKDFTKASVIDPRNLSAYTGRASARIKQKDFDGAILDCDAALKLDATNLDAYRLRAVAQSKSLRFTDAIHDCVMYLKFSKNQQSDPSQDADVHNIRGFCYLKLKNPRAAIDDYTAAIKLNPKSGDLFASRAVAYREIQDWQKSFDDTTKAMKLKPNDLSLYALRGQSLHALGDSQRALADLDHAIKFSPSPANFKARGKARLAAKDYQGAFEDFDKLVQANPDDKELHGLYDQARVNLPAKPAIKGKVD